MANIKRGEPRPTVAHVVSNLACAGTPNFPAANQGDTYYVSTAGRVGGASGYPVKVGDGMMCLADNTAAGTKAAVGVYWTVWSKVSSSSSSSSSE